MKTKDMELFSEVLHEVEKIVMPLALSPLLVPRLQLPFLWVSSSSGSRALRRVSSGDFETLLRRSCGFDRLRVHDKARVKPSLGLYPFGQWRHAHPVGLRHAPSFQQSVFQGVVQVTPMLSRNGFSGKKFVDSLALSVPRFPGNELEGILVNAGPSYSGNELKGPW